MNKLTYWLKFYTSFKGRATRYDFNIRYMLVALTTSFVIQLLDYFFLGGTSFVALAWSTLIINISFPLSCRRLHDLNCSGWWLLLVGVLLVPATFMIVLWLWLCLAFAKDPFSRAFSPIFSVMSFALIFYLVFSIFLSTKRGTIGPNKYGPDPLQTTTIETQS